MKSKRSNIDSKALAEAYKSGESLRQIGKRFAISASLARLILMGMEIKRRPEGYQRPESKPPPSRGCKSLPRYRWQHRAHRMVEEALQSGLIGRSLSCQICGRTNLKLHAHHADYNKPLEVQWLCNPCHRRWHSHNKPIYPEQQMPWELERRKGRPSFSSPFYEIET